ncbi:MAG: 50S ribosomal protein L33 [bacterium]
MRSMITLACEKCKRRNYTTTKNKRTHPDRVAYTKYCRFCGSHTAHKETR